MISGPAWAVHICHKIAVRIRIGHLKPFLRFASVVPLVLGSALIFGSAKKIESGGWVYVRLEGSPHQIGFQHGRLLAAEIDDAIRMEKVYLKKTSGQGWPFYREAARRLFWKKLERAVLCQAVPRQAPAVQVGAAVPARHALAPLGHLVRALDHQPQSTTSISPGNASSSLSNKRPAASRIDSLD